MRKKIKNIFDKIHTLMGIACISVCILRIIICTESITDLAFNIGVIFVWLILFQVKFFF